MIAYFARLLIKGVITAFLSLIIVHTVLTYIPGGAIESIASLHSPSRPLYLRLVVELLEIERPWPISSLAWLFDPTENERYSAAESYVSPGISINIAGMPIQGSGILTGDFGETFMYQRGTPVMDIIGRGTDKYLLAHLVAVLLAMTVACVQRRGRPKLHELPARLLPPMAAPRSAIRARAMYNWHAAQPLSRANRL
jgi:ABC-type dipeptide/oligopeptide/nickel transport system permease component